MMVENADKASFWERFCAPIGVEKDSTFRSSVVRLTKHSMFAGGALGIGLPLIYIVIHHFIMGKSLTWKYHQGNLQPDVVMWDKLIIMILGAISLILSRTGFGPKWGRIILALLIVAASIAALMDDIARADLAFAVGWVAFLMFVSTMIPFRAWHTLVLCIVMLGTYLLAISYIPVIAGWNPVSTRPENMVFLALVALACIGISGLIYNSHFQQFQAQRMLSEANRKLRDTQAQLVQSGKMASLGNLVAGVAHEINTPLGAIHSNAGLTSRVLAKLRAGLEDNRESTINDLRKELDKSLGVMNDVNSVTLNASERIDRIVKALRNFAQLDEPEQNQVDLHKGIESAIIILPLPKEKNIQINRDFGELPPVSCFPGQINQVFINLLSNAVEAIETEGTIRISTRQKDDWAVIEFSDTGCGIPPDKQEMVFDPGYTTKGVGVGTGLGLAICYRIIEAHHGNIELISEPGKGTSVTVSLPIK